MRPFEVLIASHGPLASALLAAAEMICGSTQGVSAVSLQPEDSPESFADRLRQALKPGTPTLILSDLYGGTPHNVACAVIGRDSNEVRCLAGVNLGLLIEAITATEPLDDELVGRLVTSSRDAIVDVSGRLAARKVTAS